MVTFLWIIKRVYFFDSPGRYTLYLIYTTGLRMLYEIICDLPVVSNNHKLFAKFHSNTLRITDTMRPMRFF